MKVAKRTLTAFLQRLPENAQYFILSSVLGALVVHALIGRQPAFSLPSVECTSWLHYLLVPVAAGLASKELKNHCE